MDVQSLINQYLSSSGAKYTREEIENAILNIAPSSYEGSNVSVFNVDSGSINQEDFRTALSNIAGKDVSADADIIFDLLNADNNDSLSLSELDKLVGTRNGHYQIESFSVWNAFSTVRNNLEQGISTGGSTTVPSDPTPTTSGGSGTTGGSSGSTGGNSGTSGNDWQFSTEVQTWRSQIASIINRSDSDGYESPEDVISYLLKNDAISQEMAEQLRASYTTFESQDEETIAAHLEMMRLVDPKATRADAIKELQQAGKIGDPVATCTSPLSEITIKDGVKVDPVKYADMLFEAMDGIGTDEATLEFILIDSMDKLSDADFVAIVEAYEKKYGLDAGGVGLVTRIEQDTSGDLQARLTSALGIRLASAANNGYDGAIDLICKEAYSGTAGQWFTANDFLESVFATYDQGGLTDEMVTKVNKRYSEIFKGRKLETDIKNDYSGLFGWRVWFPGNWNASGNGQAIINRLRFSDL